MISNKPKQIKTTLICFTFSSEFFANKYSHRDNNTIPPAINNSGGGMVHHILHTVPTGILKAYFLPVVVFAIFLIFEFFIFSFNFSLQQSSSTQLYLVQFAILHFQICHFQYLCIFRNRPKFRIFLIQNQMILNCAVSLRNKFQISNKSSTIRGIT